MARPHWYAEDKQLTVRMLLVMFLLAALYLGFIAVLWSSGMSVMGVAIFAAVLLGLQYYYSDRIVLWSMGAREVESGEVPELHAMVERLCALADLPKPRIALVDTSLPNAFATGRSPKAAVVAVTTGLLQRLDADELAAVLAHELSHVRHRDVMVITIASFFATLAQLLMRRLMWAGAFGGRRQNAAGLALIYVASLAVWVISFFLIRALSRYRELAADRGAAVITGAPSRLSSALVKISGNLQRIPTRDLREVEAMNAFLIFPALTGDAMSELFSTHPPLEKRLAQLRRLERQMEGR
ncbi:MAG: zinc metalloprotease HtpX [Thiohalomonadaceae bacterium]